MKYVIGLIAAAIVMAAATGAGAVQHGTVLILIGIPVYVVTRRTHPSGRLVAGRRDARAEER